MDRLRSAPPEGGLACTCVASASRIVVFIVVPGSSPEVEGVSRPDVEKLVRQRPTVREHRWAMLFIAPQAH